MNLHLEPQGFLGTGASLLSDLSLLAYILLIIPSLIAGYVFARRGQHRPHHKNIMIGITLFNWVLIIFLMIASYRFDILAGIGSQPLNTRYLLPTIHGLLGLPAQLLATYVIYRMLREDHQVARAKARGETQLEKYWFKQAKWTMHVVFWLWLLTAVLGVMTYLLRYDVLTAPTLGSSVPPPVTTEEPLAPVATEEAAIIEPASTEETSELTLTEEAAPAVTEDAPLETEEPEPVATDEAEPAATEEASAYQPAPRRL